MEDVRACGDYDIAILGVGPASCPCRPAAGTTLVNQDDFMVAQPWLKGVAQAHVVTYPYSLDLADLSAG